MGTKFLGTICPLQQKVGDQKSGDQMGSGPNELQPGGNMFYFYSIMKNQAVFGLPPNL